VRATVHAERYLAKHVAYQSISRRCCAAVTRRG
jgi:hypothetical protein